MTQVSTQRRQRRFVVAISILGLVALIVRFVYVVETADIPFLRRPAGDAARYLQWAGEIAAGDWVGKEPFYQAPLYPYILGAIFVVTGPMVWCVRLFQVILGSISVCLVGVGTARLFGRRAGVVAGAMLCFYPPAIFFDGLIQKAALDGFLVSWLFFLIAADVGRFLKPTAKSMRLVTTGVISGLLCLTRENALVWVPLLAVWAYSRSAGCGFVQRFGAVFSYIVGVSLVLGPVAVRNHHVGGEWSLSTFQAGPNFYIGNHIGASGRYEPLVRGHETPEFERADATRLAEEAMGRSLSARQVSQFWFGRAVDYVQADPVDWIRLMARKFLMTWNRYEVSDVESITVYGEYSVLLRGLRYWLHFGVVCPLAAMGVLWTLPRRRGLWIFWVMVLALAGSVALFFVLARYRIALVPLLIPFAAYALVRVWKIVRLKSNQPRAMGWVVAVLVGIATNLPVQDERRLDAMAYTNLGVVVGGIGEFAQAERHFIKALHDFPESVEAHFNYGYLLVLMERFLEAREHFETSLRLHPDLIHADFLLAQCKEKTGDFSGAIGHYRKALELDPTNLEARESMERILRPSGVMDSGKPPSGD